MKKDFKYSYGDKVEVVKGFYRGMRGEVTGWGKPQVVEGDEWKEDDEDIYYVVKVNNPKIGQIVVRPKDLEFKIKVNDLLPKKVSKFEKFKRWLIPGLKVKEAKGK